VTYLTGNGAKTLHDQKIDVLSQVQECRCCDVAVAQINYPSFKHNTQDSIEQARDRSHEEDSSQIFMLDDMQFGGVWMLSRLKQKKTEN
jgi:hypothetical protein